jgi:hypothetical protein
LWFGWESQVERAEGLLEGKMRQCASISWPRANKRGARSDSFEHLCLFASLCWVDSSVLSDKSFHLDRSVGDERSMQPIP